MVKPHLYQERIQMNHKISKRGINSYQLKCLGILFMTLDHIGSYLVTDIGSNLFRTIGRIAAPLFLYVAVNSARHTRNKLKYALRLYAAHVLICIITLFLTTYLEELFGEHDQFSILPVFIYMILVVWILEECSKPLFIVLAVGILILPSVLLPLSGPFSVICHIFLPDVLSVPYSPFFVMMGICWYFARSRQQQMLILIVFSCLALIGAQIFSRLGFWLFTGFFHASQFWMILFLPLIHLYNGQQGKPVKKFFYIYYPLHIYVLMLLGQWISI